jgi:hypothetical protein
VKNPVRVCVPLLEFNLIRKIDDREPFGAKAFNVSFFVLQPPLLEHAEMLVLPQGRWDLPFCEAEIQGGEMTT